MTTRLTLTLPLTLAAIAAQAAPAPAADCPTLATRAEADQALYAPVRGYEVAGPGRLHFHTAPDPGCRDPQVFVIPGDHLVAYAEHRGWVSVMYMNPRAGRDFSGWVRGERLRYTGTMGAER